MIAYQYEEKTFEYTGIQQEAQINPMMTKLKGETIYSCPRNCTFNIPLKQKEGYAIIFDKKNNNWKYEINYKGRRAYNDEGLIIIDYLGDLQGSDKLLTQAQIQGLDNGTLIWKDGKIIEKPGPTIPEQIAELEAQIEELNQKMLRDIIILNDENSTEEEKLQAQQYFNNKLAQKQVLIEKINELKNS